MKALQSIFITSTLCLAMLTGCGSDDTDFGGDIESLIAGLGIESEDDGLDGLGTGSGSGSSGSGDEFTGRVSKVSHAPERIDLLAGGGDQEAQTVLGAGRQFYSNPAGTVQFYTVQGFTDDTNYIYKVGLNSDQIWAVTQTGQTAIEPIVSGDATVIVHEPVAGLGLFTIDPDNQVQTAIGAVGATIRARAGFALTFDGSTVFFTSTDDLTGGNPGGDTMIFSMPTDGSGVITQVTPNTAGTIGALSIAVSGDGSVVFFVSDDDVLNDGSNTTNEKQVFAIDANGTNLRMLTDSTFTDSWYRIESNMDGSTVAFNFDLDLYVIDTAGPTVTLISSLAGPTEPTWDWGDPLWSMSDDGAHLSYYRGNELIVNDPANSGELVVATTGDNATSTTGNVPRAWFLQVLQDGSTALFGSSFDFGQTADGENDSQIYRVIF